MEELNNKKRLAEKEDFCFADLVEIMRILRSPDGCPWDREQNHRSIRQNLLEECYEAAEAIDLGDDKLLCEELGDVLLQVVFHSRIAKERGGFTMDDVIGGICRKLIERHPHIFADTTADTVEQVLDNWDAIKRQTKKQSTHADSMRSVSRALPALMRADKVGKKARKVGFDFSDASSAAAKVTEELAEVLSADEGSVREEIGDLLFSAVNLARALGVEPEDALTKATDKFIRRFDALETQSAKYGAFERMSVAEADEIWDDIKHNCNKNDEKR